MESPERVGYSYYRGSVTVTQLILSGVIMSAESLYTAVVEYLTSLRKSVELELHYRETAHRMDPVIVPYSAVKESRSRMDLIAMLLHNLPEGYDDVPLPDNWRELVGMYRGKRTAKLKDKAKIQRIVRRVRGEAKGDCQ